MTQMLVTVVREGTGRNAQVEGYSIAGKTGNRSEGAVEAAATRTDEGFSRYTATFAGFYPAEDPQLSMIVVIDEPVTNFYASQSAAPLFAELAKYSLQRLRIAPPADYFTLGSKLGPAPTPQPAPTLDPAAASDPETTSTPEPAAEPTGPEPVTEPVEPEPVAEPEPSATPSPVPTSEPTAEPNTQPVAEPAPAPGAENGP